MFSDNSAPLVTVSLVVLLVVLIAYLWRKHTARSADPLRVVSVKSMHDILLPDQMGGQIHLENLLLTAKGFVVLDVKTVDGTIFGGDRLDEWTVIGSPQRYTFPNPQPALYDRVAALKKFIRDMPVTGHVLFLGDAQFSKGRPTDAIFPDELQERYRKPDSAELERLMEAFELHWEKVQEVSVPAPTVVRPV
ncbi:MAG: nuclease-related domain-containing protein [Candidatus Rariloculaceae bacterium]